MTKEEFDKAFSLIESHMKKAPIEIENAYKLLKNDYVKQVKNSFEKEKLIKYLEKKIKITKGEKEFTDEILQESSAYESGLISAYQDILEKVKSGKYE